MASYNLHLMFVWDCFAFAVADKLLAASPAADLEVRKVKKPIRKTPSFDEFLAMVAAIRKNRCNGDAQASVDFVESSGEKSSQ